MESEGGNRPVKSQPQKSQGHTEKSGVQGGGGVKGGGRLSDRGETGYTRTRGGI